MNLISQLEPKTLWESFVAINQIPRASKKEEKIIAFMEAFGKHLGLDTQKDLVGNVLIKKPATKGFENHKTVVLQSHLDMVVQKNADTDFDFETMGINMYIDNDFVKAKGTTLGADNGIGVASMMAILKAKNIPHPAIEALFTIDEETGMTGAKGLQKDWIKGDILLNLDTEEDDELDIGCAGGIDVSASTLYTEIKNPFDTSYVIKISGLMGGHSGGDIHKGFGNSNKILARFLKAFSHYTFQINTIDGGGLRNAIPREASAIISFNQKETPFFIKIFKDLSNAILEEFKIIEKNISFEFEKTDFYPMGMDVQNQKNLIDVIMALHNGVYRWSPAIPNLVETSNNVARVEVDNGKIKILCLSRSSVQSLQDNMVASLESVFSLANYTVDLSGEYPGWAPNSNSEILDVMKKIYTDVFKENPKVVAVHAGLECGLIGKAYPQLDMISFGPNIFGAHSPDERVQISSVQKYWKFLLKTLENIPLKNS